MLLNGPNVQGALERGAVRYGYSLERYTRMITRAVWAGDIDTLDEVANCGCCCAQHYYRDCPAQLWNGCRGAHDDQYIDAWVRHYAMFHGMTRDQFFGDAPLT